VAVGEQPGTGGDAGGAVEVAEQASGLLDIEGRGGEIPRTALEERATGMPGCVTGMDLDQRGVVLVVIDRPCSGRGAHGALRSGASYRHDPGRPARASPAAASL
jgi:hypothetical protein